MQRRVIAVVACLVLAGCLTGPGATPTPTGDPGEPTVSPTDGGVVSFEYVVRPGSLPETVGHVSVDFAVYVAEHADDIYPCTDGAPLMDNQYDPTPTPLRTPAGDCTRFDVPRVDLADVGDSHTLGPFTVAASRAKAHTLVVHDVTLILANGTTASAVYDTDFRALTERSPPAGTYGIRFDVRDNRGTDRDRRWRFSIEVTRVVPEAD